MRDVFLRAVIESMHSDSALLERRGVTVAADPARAENHVTAGYALGEHLVVTCDPAVASMLVAATADMEPTLQAWEQVAGAQGGELLGRGRMALHASPNMPAAELPDGFTYRSLAGDSQSDRALIAQLIAASSEDDLDEAELDIDDLDPVIEVILDANGEIASYACGRPFDMAEAFGDIGILTRSDCRGRGLGTAAVTAVCQRLLAAGMEPLYRCDEDNTGSVRLSTAMGFVPATMLTAFRFTPSNL